MLICPHCGESLRRESRTFGCANGHSFDIAREGYVNLASQRAAKKAADTKEMVDARLRFLARGLYDPLIDRLKELSGDVPGPIVDVGCGPAFYLERLAGTRAATGIDLSKAALKRAARALPEATFAVADIEEGIPVATAAAGVVLSVFAPRPTDELSRILHPEGRLIVVAAGPDHVHELRDGLGLLTVPTDKETSLKEKLAPRFEIESLDHLTFPLDLDAEAATDLVAMGPNAWHRTEDSPTPAATRATAEILLLVAHPI